MKQYSLFKEKTVRSFGGSILTGRRKVRRPLDSRKPIHLVLKSTSSQLLLRNKSIVERTIRHFSHRLGIQTYKLAVHADHIHLAIRVPSRIIYIRWIRGLTSILCQRISGLKWKLRPFTRIASWGRELRRLLAYILHNHLEGELILEGHARLDRLREWAYRVAFGSG